MTLEYNQAGYGRASNERQLYEMLTDYIYAHYTDVRRQYFFDNGCQIDFFALDIYSRSPVLIEIKNWFLTIKDMEQLMKYYVHATEKYGENRFSLIVYAGGCEETRQKILTKLGIQLYLTKDLVN